MPSNEEIEQEIKERGLTAPRVTPEHIESVIAKEIYTVMPDTLHTICCLTLRNGFTVTGENACVSAENWREDMARKIARDNALDKVWMLEAYLLQEKLFWVQDLSDEIKATSEPYGYCPKCRAPGVSRERRLNGYDMCSKGHKYFSKNALLSKRSKQPPKERENG